MGKWIKVICREEERGIYLGDRQYLSDFSRMMILDLSGMMSSLLEVSSEMDASELLTHSTIKFMDHLGYVDDHVSLCGFFSFLAILICAA